MIVCIMQQKAQACTTTTRSLLIVDSSRENCLSFYISQFSSIAHQIQPNCWISSTNDWLHWDNNHQSNTAHKTEPMPYLLKHFFNKTLLGFKTVNTGSADKVLGTCLS